jgi:hypothetical protein
LLNSGRSIRATNTNRIDPRQKPPNLHHTITTLHDTGTDPSEDYTLEARKNTLCPCRYPRRNEPNRRKKTNDQQSTICRGLTGRFSFCPAPLSPIARNAQPHSTRFLSLSLYPTLSGPPAFPLLAPRMLLSLAGLCVLLLPTKHIEAEEKKSSRRKEGGAARSRSHS